MDKHKEKKFLVATMLCVNIPLISFKTGTRDSIGCLWELQTCVLSHLLCAVANSKQFSAVYYNYLILCNSNKYISHHPILMYTDQCTLNSCTWFTLILTEFLVKAVLYHHMTKPVADTDHFTWNAREAVSQNNSLESVLKLWHITAVFWNVS